MASAVSVRTRRITREQIAAAVGNNPRLIKLLEALTQDVGETLPGAVTVNTDSIDAAATLAEIAVTSAAAALAAADRAAQACAEVDALLMVQRTDRAIIDSLRRNVSDLQSIILAS